MTNQKAPVPRWRITCCNWPHRDAPHFAAWMEGHGTFTKYTYTFAEAWAYIDAVAPRVWQHLNSKKAGDPR